MAQSVLQQLKKLDDERNKLIAGAKAEAMDEVNKALAELNALGFNYRVVGGGGTQAEGRNSHSKRCPLPDLRFQDHAAP